MVTTLRGMTEQDVDTIRREAILACVPDPVRTGHFNVTVDTSYPLRFPWQSHNKHSRRRQP
jgi:hypothetical protein